MFSVGIMAHAITETLLISLPAVVHAGRGTLTRKMCDDKLRHWAEKLLVEAKIELVVSGEEHLSGQAPPYVVIVNHQSLYDIPVLFSALPFSLTMAAKKELFSVPIWGQAMRVAGFVEIDRKNSERAYEALQLAGQRMNEEQLSLMIAPEGTRSPNGELLPFKNGAFSMSKITGHPILPVVIDGTIRVHRRGDLVVHPGQTVHVRILPPLFPNSFVDVESFRDAGRRCIETALSKR